MASFITFIVRLATICLLASKGFGVSVEDVRLVGDSNNYINMRSDVPYALKCTFRAGYDDPVTVVTWYKDGVQAYVWNEGETIATAFQALSGRVITTGKSELQNIYFNKRLTFDLAGNYTCEVTSRKGTVRSKPFKLSVIDIPSDNFISNVTLMSEDPEAETLTPNEDQNCTLLWDFQTPAIFPRPNVTCGYYSYLHDDVTSSLPAGLGMQLLTNGSWQAGFEHIRIQVAEIPRDERLGCAVSVPGTTFKKVVKFEDNFAIDHLIDSEGCSALFLDPSYRIQYSADGGEMNCRGDLVPSSDMETLHIKISCAPGDLAVFHNGSAFSSWSTEMICDPMDLTWSKKDNGVMSPIKVDIEKEIPICVPNGNTGSKLHSVFRVTVLLLCFLGFNNCRHLGNLFSQ